MSMSSEDFYYYYEAITVIEAQETLIACKVASYPNMKAKPKQDFHRSLVKKAYPNETKKVVTISEMEKIINAR